MYQRFFTLRSCNCFRAYATLLCCLFSKDTPFIFIANLLLIAARNPCTIVLGKVVFIALDVLFFIAMDIACSAFSAAVDRAVSLARVLVLASHSNGIYQTVVTRLT